MIIKYWKQNSWYLLALCRFFLDWMHGKYRGPNSNSLRPLSESLTVDCGRCSVVWCSRFKHRDALLHNGQNLPIFCLVFTGKFFWETNKNHFSHWQISYQNLKILRNIDFWNSLSSYMLKSIVTFKNPHFSIFKSFDMKFVFFDKSWVKKMPHKWYFGQNNKNIPNQTILHEFAQ